MPKRWSSEPDGGQRKLSAKRALRAGLHHHPRAGRTELYVVPSAQLAAACRPTLDRLDAEAQDMHQTTGRIGGRAWLAASMQISGRAIYRFEHETRYTGLSFADAVLTILGLQHALSDGTIDVLPNPSYHRTLWIEQATESGVENAEEEWDRLAPLAALDSRAS